MPCQFIYYYDRFPYETKVRLFICLRTEQRDRGVWLIEFYHFLQNMKMAFNDFWLPVVITFILFEMLSDSEIST